MVRRRWILVGQVQGVGFRPFVYRAARQFGVYGFVRNDRQGVTIEAQGLDNALDQLAQALARDLPPLAAVDGMACTSIETVAGVDRFEILASDGAGDAAAGAEVTVDAALCADCRRELVDPGDARYRYGLINCTNCGPRYSIVRGVPYDRPNTTMSDFAMCAACQAEYTDPADRRFHAQPIACHACGPKVALVDPAGVAIAGDACVEAARRLAGGQVVAIKGLGGFHLAVRADDDTAVAGLRRRKRRDHKPFALMARTLECARRWVALSDAAATAMRSPAAPVMLGPRRHGCPAALSVAPGNHRLGLMLPYTPVHHLLFDTLDDSIDALVMTSGNLTDEPLAIDNAEAVARLGGLCDAMLWHDRPIARCVDDSVWLDMGDAAPLPLRRARGAVPGALPLPRGAGLAGLCVGGDLKNTVAVVRGGEAVLSQHLGDLAHPLAFVYFQQAVADLCDLFGVDPRWVACDLHPMYLSAAHARSLAARWDVPLVGVQHHHAHAAAVLAEHDQAGPALAVVCDGMGYGTDGSIWGGELLLADVTGFGRLAHLRPLRLPGGDAAARDTCRCALAMLHQALGDDFDQHPAMDRLLPQADQRQMLAAMVRRNVNCATSSGTGRFFDGAAALLGLCQHNAFEGQAPQCLESAAADCPTLTGGDMLPGVSGDDPVCIDLSPLTRALVAGVARGEPVSTLAGLFHDQLARAWAVVVAEQARRTGVRTVALTGGVFCNQRLTETLTALLQRESLTVLRHRVVPPNDGGLALGQAAVAAARIAAGLVD